MTQFEKMVDLLKQNGVDFRTSAIYDEFNYQYKAIWFDVGHIEFDLDDNVTKVVNW